MAALLYPLNERSPSRYEAHMRSFLHGVQSTVSDTTVIHSSEIKPSPKPDRTSKTPQLILVASPCSSTAT